MQEDGWRWGLFVSIGWRGEGGGEEELGGLSGFHDGSDQAAWGWSREPFLTKQIGWLGIWSWSCPCIYLSVFLSVGLCGSANHQSSFTQSPTHWPGPLSPVSCLWHSYWTRLWLMLKLELNWVSQTVFGSSWHETKGPPRRTLNLVPESKQICFDAGAHMHRYMDMYTKAGLTCQ